MAVYFVTGKLGAGKTLSAVGRIRDYLLKGRRVATNLDLKLDHLLPIDNRSVVVRLPDKPRVEDLTLIGTGDGASLDEYDESRFGLLVLDELASWFNTRAWNDKSRAAVIEWFLHARKYHWDILFLVQDIDAVDKQLRASLCEHLVVCRRLDRVSVPVIGGVVKALSGRRLPMPKIHVASVFYGESAQGIKVDRWWYRGTDLYGGYRTGQVFTFDQMFTSSGDAVDMRATYSLLSPWHVSGRYATRRPWWQVASDALKRAVLVLLHVIARVTGRSPVTLAISWGVASPGLLSRYRTARLLHYGRRVRADLLRG